MKANELLDNLKIDLRPRREGKREKALRELNAAYSKTVEAAADYTYARHGSVGRWDAGMGNETAIYPGHVDPTDAIAGRGQPAGWKLGVILIRIITLCDKSTVITTDLASVEAAAAGNAS